MGLAAGAAIAGVATIGGAYLSSSAQEKAAGQATDSADRTAAMNNALEREVYAQNQAYLSPYAARGNDAGNAINALLGLGSSTTGTTANGGYGSAAPYGAQPQDEDTWATGALNALRAEVNPSLWARVNSITDPSDRLAALEPMMFRRDREAYGDYLSSNPRPAPPPPGTAPGTAPPKPTQGDTGVMPPPNAGGGQGPVSNISPQNAAFNNYLNSTGYQFQVDQGNKAINQGYAAKGSLQSGAAMKALQTYGQNTATGFFKDYLGLLGNQQGVGLAGASAIAGVGSNYANSVSANNNNASAAAQQAAYGVGNANAALYGNIAGAIGGVAGSAFGSSYRPPGG